MAAHGQDNRRWERLLDAAEKVCEWPWPFTRRSWGRRHFCIGTVPSGTRTWSDHVCNYSSHVLARLARADLKDVEPGTSARTISPLPVAALRVEDPCSRPGTYRFGRPHRRPAASRIYTNAHLSEPMSLLVQAEGHHPPWLIDEPVPGEAAVVDDVVVGFEDAVRQPVFAHELPHVLDRVSSRHLGGSGISVMLGGTTGSADPCHSG
ncbi:hypothetical protein NOVOSPHI9U_200024 [Novosphingobium sp. 9U]|nr:hypothetical protein NOVOSPHI9U_200024 [Novosphingobium sp. 9U]